MTDDLLRPLKEQLHKLRALIDKKSEVRLGTDAPLSPLSVYLDGDTDTDPNSPTFGDPIATPATSLVSHTVGQRVICAEQHRRVLIIQSA